MSQIVIYENDAVVVSNIDGSGLELAPCGSVFNYHYSKQTDQHPLQGHETVQQRCEFVTSAYRDQVRQALYFRNQFAERPFLIRALLQPEHVSIQSSDTCEISWPVKLRHAKYSVLPDGSVRLLAYDQPASFVLHPSRQTFQVEFCCHTSQPRQRDVGSRNTRTHVDDTQTHADEKDPAKARVDKLLKYCVKWSGQRTKQQTSATEFSGSDSRREHGRVIQRFSVNSYPEHYRHPLSLALQVAQAQRTVSFEDTGVPKSVPLSSDGLANQNSSTDFVGDADTKHRDCSQNENELLRQTENAFETVSAKGDLESEITDAAGEKSVNCAYSPTPKALPLNCIAPHMHRWCNHGDWGSEAQLLTSAMANGRVKVLQSRGVIYRFLWSLPRGVEVDVGDGSVLRSSGLSAHFFTHYCFTNGKVEEKMYNTARPPPDIPGARFSLGKIVATAGRFLRHMIEDSGPQTVICCWRGDGKSQRVVEPLSTVLLEECDVPGVGRFSAYSSGRMRVLFADRTALDMLADFSPRLGACRQHSDPDVEQAPDIHTYRPRSRHSRHVMSELPPGAARLLLPNGHYHTTLMSQPGAYLKYTQAAREWVNWVNSSPTQRTDFYKDTLYDPDKTREIERELRKISCFNYIVEKTLLNDTDPSSAASYHYPEINTSNFDASDALAGFSYKPPQIGDFFTTTPPIKQDTTLYSTNTTEKNPSSMLETPLGYDCSSYFPSQNHSTADSTKWLPGGDFSKISSTQADVNFDLVQEVLRRTARTVSDLDNYLRHNGETSPVKDK